MDTPFGSRLTVIQDGFAESYRSGHWRELDDCRAGTRRGLIYWHFLTVQLVLGPDLAQKRVSDPDRIPGDCARDLTAGEGDIP